MSASTPMEEVLGFWFGEPAASARELRTKLTRWFGNPEVARQVRERFGELIESARSGGLTEWEDSPRGKLALVILLDQLMRSYYGMDDRRAFDGQERSTRLALELLDDAGGERFTLEEHLFLLIAVGHSEDLELNQQAVPETLAFVERCPVHLRPLYEIITSQSVRFRGVLERFGRFPHRNAALGRTDTAEEAKFLESWQTDYPNYDQRLAEAEALERARQASSDRD